MGRISTFLNIDEIFKDYINHNKDIINEIGETIDKSTLDLFNKDILNEINN